MLRSKLMTENMRMALETIRTHKARSFLTVLGVVIGVAVAIITASILLGFDSLGTGCRLPAVGSRPFAVIRREFQ